MLDAAEAISEPRRRLGRVHIHPSLSVFTAPEGIRPEVWRVIGPLAVIAETLREHGFIELTQRTLLDPGRWRFKTVGLPGRVRNAVHDVYRWAHREWIRGGTAFVQAAGRSLESKHAEDILAFRHEGQTERFLPVLKTIIEQRNQLARLVDGTTKVNDGSKPVEEWPRLADFVFALDQGLDRIADLGRRTMIRRYLEGRLSEEEKRSFAELLDAHQEAGMWPNPERDINEVALSLGLDLHNVVPLRADQRQ